MFLLHVLLDKERCMDILHPCPKAIPTCSHVCPNISKNFVELPKNCIERCVVGCESTVLDALITELVKLVCKLISLGSELLRHQEVPNLSYEELSWLLRSINNSFKLFCLLVNSWAGMSVHSEKGMTAILSSTLSSSQ